MEVTRIADRIARSAEPADEQFRLLVSSVTDYAIYLLDPAGRVASWNAGAERIKGYRAGEVIGRHYAMFYPLEERAAGRPEQNLAIALREGRCQGQGWRVRRDGSRFWAEITITPLYDPGGALKGYAKVTRDMTERHAHEERLRESERRFRLLVQGVSDYAIYMLSPEGEITSWNAGAARIKGYAEAEVLGRHFEMFFTAEERAAGRPRRALESARRSGRCADEGWRLRKDGSRFWALTVLDAIHDESGELLGFAKITRDLTERRAVEEQARQAEALLTSFTDNSPALMSLKDRAGRYRFVNARFLERHGLRREQAIGRSDAELFPQREAIAMTAHDARVVTRAESVQFEERWRAPDGERFAMVSKFPLLDAKGTVTGIGMVASDITERRLGEQALNEQRALLAEAQKLAGVGSWEWDPQSGRVLWSEQLYRIYGVAPETFRPSFENYLELVHPEDRSNSGAMMARALMDGRPFTMHERIVRPGGEVRYLRSHGEVVRNPYGRPVKILGACLDVTEQRHSETALRQAAQDLHGLTRRLVQAEEAERRRIAAELHDRVGQSLSALNINLDIIAKTPGLAAPVKQRLEDSAELVDTTLQSIESVMAELRPPLLDEYGLAAALDWHAQEYSRRTGIRVTLDREAADAAGSLRIEAALALFRIAQEALNNVLKHARASAVRIELALAGSQVALTVHDDGRGFDPAELPRGRLGMTTMRERAEAAGGQLQVDSAPGKGTRVTATVPL
ncbi:MAG TPA: PAS domain S-box protein [Burkholderiales bacterium]